MLYNCMKTFMQFLSETIQLSTMSQQDLWSLAMKYKQQGDEGRYEAILSYMTQKYPMVSSHEQDQVMAKRFARQQAGQPVAPVPGAAANAPPARPQYDFRTLYDFKKKT